uniref:Uncharacterized protein n=1 Tax=Palpitomonas bilix TaxID=652834 RepID=A0A7S3DGS8_9EUKA
MTAGDDGKVNVLEFFEGGRGANGGGDESNGDEVGIVMTAGDDGKVKFISARTGGEVGVVDAHTTAVSVAAFSPPPLRKVVTATMLGDGFLWDLDKLLHK